MTSVVVCLRSPLLSDAVAEALTMHYGIDAVPVLPRALADAVGDLDVTCLVVDGPAAREVTPSSLGVPVVVIGQRQDDAVGLGPAVNRVPIDTELDQLAVALRAATPSGPVATSSPRTVTRRTRRASDAQKLLTEREQQVLELVASAATSKQIAGEIGVSEHTVRTHLQNLLGKLDARSKVDAVARGRELGLLRGTKLP